MRAHRPLLALRPHAAVLQTRRLSPALAAAALLTLGGCALQVDAQELIAQERHLAELLRTGNNDGVEDLLAEEFRVSYVEPGTAPATVARDEWLDGIANGESADADELHVLRPVAESIGEGLVAVEFAIDRNVIEDDGRMRRERRTITDIWVKRGGSWLLASRILATPPTAPGN